jgi:hypothetical protein
MRIGEYPLRAASNVELSMSRVYDEALLIRCKEELSKEEYTHVEEDTTAACEPAIRRYPKQQSPERLQVGIL